MTQYDGNKRHMRGDFKMKNWTFVAFSDAVANLMLFSYLYKKII